MLAAKTRHVSTSNIFPWEQTRDATSEVILKRHQTDEERFLWVGAAGGLRHTLANSLQPAPHFSSTSIFEEVIKRWERFQEQQINNLSIQSRGATFGVLLQTGFGSPSSLTQYPALCF